MNSQFKGVLVTLGFTAAIITLVIVFAGGDDNGYTDTPSKYDEFAQCLADKGAIMYGADWCSWCKQEKEAFGNSFRFINYVECPDDPQRCLAVGIENYPTWTFPDRQLPAGAQGLEKLSEESGCSLPTETE